MVVEGEMAVQFFKRGAGGALEKDGVPLVLKKGDCGHIAANRIHDAKWVPVQVPWLRMWGLAVVGVCVR